MGKAHEVKHNDPRSQTAAGASLGRKVFVQRAFPGVACLPTLHKGVHTPPQRKVVQPLCLSTHADAVDCRVPDVLLRSHKHRRCAYEQLQAQTLMPLLFACQCQALPNNQSGMFRGEVDNMRRRGANSGATYSVGVLQIVDKGGREHGLVLESSRAAVLNKRTAHKQAPLPAARTGARLLRECVGRLSR